MKIKYLLISAIIVSSLLIGRAYAVAQDNNTQDAKVTTNSGQQTDKKYHIQTFPLHGSAEVKLNFVYEHKKLKYIIVKNVGGEDKKADEIMVNLLGKNHVLGEGDGISLDAPNVSKIVLHVQPYAPEHPTKAFHQLMPSKTYLFTRNKAGMYLLHTKATPVLDTSKKSKTANDNSKENTTSENA